MGVLRFVFVCMCVVLGSSHLGLSNAARHLPFLCIVRQSLEGGACRVALGVVATPLAAYGAVVVARAAMLNRGL